MSTTAPNAPAPSLTASTIPSSDTFRTALRGAVAQVSVITLAMPDGEWSGITLTSANALSTQPPMMIACINRSASAHSGLAIGAVLGWQLLGAAQAGVATAFSGTDGRRGAARFDGAQWALHDRARLLVGAPLACAVVVENLSDFATHTVVIGRITALIETQGAGALAYRDGAYLPLP